jgi:PAS domain S-box-containing protein
MIKSSERSQPSWVDWRVERWLGSGLSPERQGGTDESRMLSHRSRSGAPFFFLQSLSGRYFAISAVLATCYVAAGKLGLALAIVNPSASPVWAPTGIAFAALLVLGVSYWPAIFIGAFLINIITAGTVLTSLGIATGNTLEALAGVYLVNRFASGRNFLERPQTIFRFVFLAAVVSTAVSATIGVTCLALGGFANWADYGSVWLTWWMGDAVGDILLVPVLLTFWTAPAMPRWDRRKIVEACALFASLAVVSLLLFGRFAAFPVNGDFGMKFLVIPLLLWAAFRFGLLEGAMAVLLVACVAIWSLIQGPFLTNGTLVWLQGFLGIAGIMTTTVAAVVAQQKKAEQVLRNAHDELEAQVEMTGNALADAIREVRLKEASLARAQQIAHTGSFHWDVASDKVTCSAEMHRIYGRTSEQVSGTMEEFLSWVHPEDAGAVRTTVERALQSNQSFQIRERILRPDGEIRLLESAGEVVINTAGQAVALNGVSRDITEENRAEEARRRSEANFRGLMEHAPDAMVVADYSGTIVLVNAQAEMTFGYHRTELLGQPVEMLVPERLRENHPAHRRLFAANPRARPMGEGRALSARRKDGSEFPVEISLSPLHTEEGGLVSSVIRDITERKQAEYALQEVAGKLINAQEAERSRLARELHDDFSQRLVLLAMQLDRFRLQHATDAPMLAEQLEDLGRQVIDLTEDVHRLSHGLHSSLLEHLGLVPALQSLIAEFSERRGIPVLFAPESIPQKLPAEVALCLYRIVQEGLSNIAKHSGAQSARVELSQREDGVHLMMEDQGVGFDLQNLDGKGGLGFISMRERLRLVQGHYNVRSAPQEGTRIDVWIPTAAILDRLLNETVASASADETAADTLL